MRGWKDFERMKQNSFSSQSLCAFVADQPSTFNYQPSTFNYQLSTFNHQPSTFNHQPSTFNLELSTFNLFVPLRAFASSWRINLQLQLSTINIEPSTLNIIFCLDQDFQDERMERFRKMKQNSFSSCSLEPLRLRGDSTINYQPSTLNLQP